MGCIAAAYNYFNRADPDCGTTFAWVSRAMGPNIGWMSGWAVLVADVLVMPSLASIAGIYSCQLFGVDDPSILTVTIIGVAWIFVMTAICYIGIELSARTQQLLLTMEIVTLALFSFVALYKVYADEPKGSIKPSLSWINPFDDQQFQRARRRHPARRYSSIGAGTPPSASTRRPRTARRPPGKAAVVATFILLGIYVFVAAASQAFGGTQLLIDNQADVFAPIAKDVLGSPLDKLLIIAVLTSASASTQTTILPATRSALSMARHKALPDTFGEVHPRYQTPSTSTIWMGVVSIARVRVPGGDEPEPDRRRLHLARADDRLLLRDHGYACTWFYRRHLFKSLKNFLYLAFLPLLGAGILTWVFIKASIDYSATDGGYAKPFLGVGSPVVITAVMIILGLVLLIAQRINNPTFFKRKPEPVDPALMPAVTGEAPA